MAGIGGMLVDGLVGDGAQELDEHPSPSFARRGDPGCLQVLGEDGDEVVVHARDRIESASSDSGPRRAIGASPDFQERSPLTRSGYRSTEVE